METKERAAERGLRGLIGEAEARAIRSAMRGEEGEHFKGLLEHWSRIIADMPSAYQTDGQGANAVAYLHYFTGSADWYITEKDAGTPDEPGQHQAFGWADLGCGGELGYISIKDRAGNKSAGAELTNDYGRALAFLTRIGALRVANKEFCPGHFTIECRQKKGDV